MFITFKNDNEYTGNNRNLFLGLGLNIGKFLLC